MSESTLITIIFAAGAALAATVTYLFKLIMSQSNKHAELSTQVGRLQGEKEGQKRLSEKVLQTVEDAINNRENKAT